MPYVEDPALTPVAFARALAMPAAPSWDALLDAPVLVPVETPEVGAEEGSVVIEDDPDTLVVAALLRPEVASVVVLLSPDDTAGEVVEAVSEVVESPEDAGKVVELDAPERVA